MTENRHSPLIRARDRVPSPAERERVRVRVCDSVLEDARLIQPLRMNDDDRATDPHPNPLPLRGRGDTGQRAT
jgi:hypothetical protein